MLLPDLAPGFLAYNDSGNGIGYSYFTVRGFGQARTRVTLNGAPLNDAESGELFFIDLADFMSTAGDVQLSRGVFGLSGIGGALDITTRLAGARALVHAPGRRRQLRDAAPRRPLRLGPGRRHLVAGGPLLEDPDGRLSRPVLGRDVEHVPLALALRRALDAARQLLRRPGADAPRVQRHPEERARRRPHRATPTATAARTRSRYPGELDDFVQPHFQVLHDFQLGAGTRLSQTFYAFRGDGSYEQLRQQRTLAEYNLPDVVLADGTTIAESDLVRKRIVGEWDYGWVPTFSHRQGPFTLTVSGELRLHDAHHWGEVKWAQYYPAGDRAGPPLLRLPRQEGHRDRLGAGSPGTRAPGSRCRPASSSRTSATSCPRIGIKGVSLDQGYSFVLPRFGAIVHLAKDADAYLNVARGGRAPNRQQIYDPEDYYAVPATRLDPENVIDYEAGVSLRRGAWRARVNAFFMDFKNEIVYAGALDDNGVPIYGNGARSRHSGIEAEGSWSPSPHLGLDGHLSLSRNTFTQLPGVRLGRRRRLLRRQPDRGLPRRHGRAHRQDRARSGAAQRHRPPRRPLLSRQHRGQPQEPGRAGRAGLREPRQPGVHRRRRRAFGRPAAALEPQARRLTPRARAARQQPARSPLHGLRLRGRRAALHPRGDAHVYAGLSSDSSDVRLRPSFLPARRLEAGGARRPPRRSISSDRASASSAASRDRAAETSSSSRTR